MVKAASVLASLLRHFVLSSVRLSQETAKPDSPEVRQLLETAKKNAGAEWTEAFDFICALNAGRANSPTDPVIEPTKVFDNLSVVGRTSTAVWVVSTSAGIVLIDSGYGDQLESVLLPGMKTLGRRSHASEVRHPRARSRRPFRRRRILSTARRTRRHGGARLGSRRDPATCRPGRGDDTTTEARHRRRRGSGDHGWRRRLHAGDDSGAHAGIDGRDLPGEGRTRDSDCWPVWRKHPHTRTDL